MICVTYNIDEFPTADSTSHDWVVFSAMIGNRIAQRDIAFLRDVEEYLFNNGEHLFDGQPFLYSVVAGALTIFNLEAASEEP